MRLMWSSASTSLRVVPARHLLQTRHIAGSPFRGFRVSSAPTSAPHTVAYGTGLSRTIAGVPARFTVMPRDALSNRRYAPRFSRLTLSSEAAAARARTHLCQFSSSRHKPNPGDSPTVAPCRFGTVRPPKKHGLRQRGEPRPPISRSSRL